MAGLALGAWAAHMNIALPTLGENRSYAREVRQEAGPRIRVVYMVPSDGTDRRLDLDGSIATSVTAAQDWFELKSGGMRLKVEADRGRQILFHRSRLATSEWLAAGKHAAYRIEAELREAGWDDTRNVLGVYFDGPHLQNCGDSISPDAVNVGRIAILYLSSAWPAVRPCRSIPLAVQRERPGYWEFLFLHEIVHALGFVPSCASHPASLDHVSDSPADLMYRGPLEWKPDDVDVKRDDYFRHGKTGCPDLADSPYLLTESAER